MPDFLAMSDALLKDLQSDAEKKGIEFIHSNFEKQGFTDSAFEAWQPRKKAMDYFLLRVTNNLFNSIDVESSSRDKIVFKADSPYAAIHNEGLSVKTTAQIDAYINRNFMGKGKQVEIKAHTRRLNYVMTKRQFMGNSVAFNNDWHKHVSQEIEKRFKQHLNTI